MKILSAAKINLTLKILGRRRDGFHELATWMLPIGLYDSVEIERAGQQSFFSNLIIRAAQVFNQAASIDMPYTIRLEKKIPIGSGLGGGSSNAAAALRLLNELHNCPFDGRQLEELAANLGSDRSE